MFIAFIVKKYNLGFSTKNEIKNHEELIPKKYF